MSRIIRLHTQKQQYLCWFKAERYKTIRLLQYPRLEKNYFFSFPVCAEISKVVYSSDEQTLHASLALVLHKEPAACLSHAIGTWELSHLLEWKEARMYFLSKWKELYTLLKEKREKIQTWVRNLNTWRGANGLCLWRLKKWILAKAWNQVHPASLKNNFGHFWSVRDVSCCVNFKIVLIIGKHFLISVFFL